MSGIEFALVMIVLAGVPTVLAIAGIYLFGRRK